MDPHSFYLLDPDPDPDPEVDFEEKTEKIERKLVIIFLFLNEVNMDQLHGF